MVPLIDDYLQMYLVEKLKFLKAHPILLDRIFSTGRRKTLEDLKNFIVNKQVRVILGYPRDQTTLPCYVIVLAPESEVPMGLGDDEGDFEGLEYDDELVTPENEAKQNLAIKKMSPFLDGVYMASSYRIECWSDNADLTSYMYAILKWCIWTSRSDMLKRGWIDIKISGTDMEPTPDYMPMFIYRRTLQLSLMYENKYYDNLSSIETYIDICQNPNNYKVDSQGNILEKSSGNVVIPRHLIWILQSEFYDKETGIQLFKELRQYSTEDKSWTLIKGEEEQ